MITKVFTTYGKFFVVSSILFLLACLSDDPNPYLDVNSVDIYVSPNDFVTDSVYIFETFEFKISMKNSKRILNLSVEMDGNRLWKGQTEKIIDSSVFKYPDSLKIQCSYKDTGLHYIKVTAKVDNGTTKTLDTKVISFYPKINEVLPEGNRIILRVPPVKDSVYYNWIVGDEPWGSTKVCTLDISGQYSETRIYNSSVRIYIDKDSSQPFTFTTNIIDNIPPKLEPQSMRVNDTLIAYSTPELIAKFDIDESSAIRKLTINGQPFDSVTPDYCLKELDRLDTLSGKLNLIVRAEDNYGNVFLDTFFVKYVPNLALEPEIALKNQLKDTVNSKLIRIDASIKNITKTLQVILSLNDSIISITNVEKNTDTSWENISLREGNNTIILMLYDKLMLYNNQKSDTLSIIKENIVYVKNTSVDTIKPSILFVKERTTGNSLYNFNSNRDSVINVEIQAYDESGIKDVTIKGISLTTTDSTKFQGSITLKHPYDTIKIKVVDNANNFTETTAFTTYNRQPIIVPADTNSFISNPVQTQLIYRVLFSDPDNDLITTSAILTTHATNPLLRDSMAIPIRDSILFWTPEVKDTGIATLRISAKDPYSISVYKDINIIVTLQNTQPVNGEFIEDSVRIPDTIRVGFDHLKDTLVTNPNFFGSNLLTNVSIKTIDTTYQIINKSLENILTWTPSTKDTGKVTLTAFLLRASDQINTDTLTRTFYVKPRIKTSFTRDTLSVLESTKACTVKVQLDSPCLKDSVQVNLGLIRRETDLNDSVALKQSFILFNKGEQERNVVISFANDPIYENSEKFSVFLRLPPGSPLSLGSRDTLEITIKNDDAQPTTPLPRVCIDTKASSGNEDIGSVYIPVKLKDSTETKIVKASQLITISVKSSTDNINGSNGYQVEPSQLIFNMGDSIKDIKLTIKDDSLCEKAEKITITLSNSDGKVSLGSNVTYTFTINANDSQYCKPRAIVIAGFVTAGNSPDNAVRDTLVKLGYNASVVAVDQLKNVENSFLASSSLIYISHTCVGNVITQNLNSSTVPIICGNAGDIKYLTPVLSISSQQASRIWIKEINAMAQIFTSPELIPTFKIPTSAVSLASTKADQSQSVCAFFPKGTIQTGSTVLASNRAIMPLPISNENATSFLNPWWNLFRSTVIMVTK